MTYMTKTLLCTRTMKPCIDFLQCTVRHRPLRNIFANSGFVIHQSQIIYVIGIDTKIEVIVASPTTWEAHHSPRAKPEGCGELLRSLVTQQ